MKARISLLLICIASVIAAGSAKQASREGDFVLENRGKFVNNEVKYGRRAGDSEEQYTPTQNEYRAGMDLSGQGYGGVSGDVKKQAFLIAALTKVNEPKVEQKLQQLGQNLVTDEQKYIGNVDNDMQQILELAAYGRMLGRQNTYNGFKPSHVKQMNGWSKLLARSSDWKTFQQNVCFARENLNVELYVNALLLAIKERPDTQDLVVPAINEIIPEQFYDEELLQQVKNIQPSDLAASGASINPQFGAIVVEGGGYSWWPRSQYSQIPAYGSYGQQQRVGIQQKPWQQWRQERVSKISALKEAKSQQKKIIFPVNVESVKAGNELNRRISYLTEDAGLKNFWYSFNLYVLNKMDLQTEQIQANRPETQFVNANKPGRGWFSTSEQGRDQGSRKQYGQGSSVEGTLRGGSIVSNEGDSYETRGPQEYSAINIRRFLNRDNIGRYGQDSGSIFTRTIKNENEQSSEEEEGSLLTGNRWWKNRQANIGVGQGRKQYSRTSPIGSKNLFQQGWPESSFLRGQQDSSERRYTSWGQQSSDESSSEEDSKQGGIRGQNIYASRGGKSYFQRQEDLKKPRSYLQGLSQQGLPYSQQGSSERRYTSWGQQSSEESGSEEGSMQGDIRGQRNYYSKGGKSYIQTQEYPKEPRGPFHMIWKSSQESGEEYKPSLGDRGQIFSGKHRMVRDVSKSYGPNADISESRAGEIFIVNIQQVLARLQMEQLSHQLEDLLSKGSKSSYGQYKTSQWSRQQPINTDFGSMQRLEGTRGEQEQLALIEKGENVERSILKEELKLLSSRGQISLQQTNIVEAIGRILSNQVSGAGLGVLNLWSHLDEQLDVIQQQHPSTTPALSYSDYAKGLQNPVYTYSLERAWNMVNSYIELQPSYSEDDLRLSGVQLKNVKIDKLQTYFDVTDSDLSNALDRESMLQQDVDQSKLEAIPVGRQARLNHKSFTLKYDVSSTKPQRVVIRTFLGPKLDAEGNELSLEENRNNFVLLDAFISELNAGRNSIKRKSGDIEWTSEDSTPLTKIYQQVMQGMKGSGTVWLQQNQANNCHFPQRLLLPRGLPQGLPMQVLTIVSPVIAQDSHLQQQQQVADKICSMGIAAIALDSQSLGFPLDRKFENEKIIIDAPNALMKDVSIYHEGPLNPSESIAAGSFE